ncbi:MAG: glycosyl hydrolase family 28 protein [Verrucomicrobiia bacterium]
MRRATAYAKTVLVAGLLVAAASTQDAVATTEIHKILFLGNSITWTIGGAGNGVPGNWGMAASAEEKDYVHLVTRALSKTTGSTPEIMVKNIAKFERQYANFDVDGTFKEEFAFGADLVILAIGENVPKLDSAEAKAQFKTSVMKLLNGLRANHRPRIIVRSCFWPNQDRDPILKQACQEVSGTYVDIGSLSKDESNYARSERKFSHAGVAAHPGDKGMQAIANAILGAINGQQGQPKIVSWPAPAGEALSEDYQIKVNGQPVPVHACRVSAVPFNQVWPGYQRPLDQTELAGFACWDMEQPVQVEVQSRSAVRSAVVRPTSFGIRPVIEGNRISFSLDRPRPVVVEVNGTHHALHLFASPPEKDAPAPNTPGVRFFGPGVHRPGRIELKSNETVYLAGGAVVYGSIQAKNATNVRIAGRGVLDVSEMERGKGAGAIRLFGCSNVTVEGIVMRDPDVWCCSLFGCSQVTISNVKLVGLWRYNADGIDVCNSQDVVVCDSFVRAFDDALVVKGLKVVKKHVMNSEHDFDDRPVRNIRFSRCVVWCDWGRALEIGAETCAPEITGVAFEDCDVVRTTHIAMDIQHGDRAAVRNIRFEGIRVEIDDQNPCPKLQKNREEKYLVNAQDRFCPSLMVIVIRKTPYSKDATQGVVREIVFKDISLLSRLQPPSSFRGLDAEHNVEGVTIQNLRFNGRPIRDAAGACLTIGSHVGGVQFLEKGTEK